MFYKVEVERGSRLIMVNFGDPGMAQYDLNRMNRIVSRDCRLTHLRGDIWYNLFSQRRDGLSELFCAVS